MSQLKDKLFQDLTDAVVNLDEDKTRATAQQVITEGIDAFEAIDKGLTPGMETVSRLYDEQEYFVPELLVAADAVYGGLEVLRPYIKGENNGKLVKIVIGVIEGDTHDIGKNLVRIILETEGYEVIDVGRDVPPDRFVEKAKEVGADVIALSTLMTTTMEGMGEVVELLKAEGIRNRFKVIVGGAPLSQAYSNKIGADGYAPNAKSAARLIKRLLTAEPVVA
ncbi:MAG: corrinoid protein [Chlorobiaceae bacterium]|nr:corrinoid protein [Chlorobiaceae bacterium]